VPSASHFLLDAQKKVTKEKGTLPLLLRKRKEPAHNNPYYLGLDAL
jgi:hypothetical protein